VESNVWHLTRIIKLTEFNFLYILLSYVRFDVPTAVVLNVAILWDIAPCSPYVSRRLEGKY
jgi:hypothetical protein